MCPITVKKALNKVDGVTRTDVSYEDKQAVISYDDALTNPDTLIEATTNAGYPSLLMRADES
jgi:mercuric ion binding protein